VVRGGKFEVAITHDALDHIRALARKEQRLVLDTLREKLGTQPAVETRNRKRLHLPAPFGAHWELRFGAQNRLRAFYTIEEGTVVVVAVGVKHRERLLIGRTEVKS
jgi:mRNA-degrading endonuclease RelE of RelBE toxin-antitoxin system